MAELAIDVVKATTQFVAAQAWEEISLAWGFQGHLKNLDERFKDTQKFLEGVGSAKDIVKDQCVTRWIQKVKNATYFADNIMDDYAYEILRQELELGKKHSNKKKVCRFFTCTNNPIVFRFQMTHKVVEILSKFDKLDKEAKKIALKLNLARRETLNTASTSSHCGGEEREKLQDFRKNAFPSASTFVGRKTDKKNLIELMCDPINDQNHLSIIAIVGLGGLGKTALARAVYDEKEKVEKHFDKKMWICVSEDFNAERIFKEMVESVSSNKCDVNLMDVIIQKLQKQLKGKKFLLVLDDVWEENKARWETFINKARW